LHKSSTDSFGSHKAQRPARTSDSTSKEFRESQLHPPRKRSFASLQTDTARSNPGRNINFNLNVRGKQGQAKKGKRTRELDPLMIPPKDQLSARISEDGRVPSAPTKPRKKSRIQPVTQANLSTHKSRDNGWMDRKRPKSRDCCKTDQMQGKQQTRSGKSRHGRHGPSHQTSADHPCKECPSIPTYKSLREAS
jgi:hypothetical protein